MVSWHGTTLHSVWPSLWFSFWTSKIKESHSFQISWLLSVGVAAILILLPNDTTLTDFNALSCKNSCPQKGMFYKQILLSFLHFVLKLKLHVSESFFKKKLLPFDCPVSLQCHCWLYIVVHSYHHNIKLTNFFPRKGNFTTKCRN